MLTQTQIAFLPVDIFVNHNLCLNHMVTRGKQAKLFPHLEVIRTSINAEIIETSCFAHWMSLVPRKRNLILKRDRERNLVILGKQDISDSDMVKGTSFSHCESYTPTKPLYI
jgi:hypothetical protein